MEDYRQSLRGSDIGRLDVWLDDAQASGIYAIVRLVRTLHQNIAAVRNAITEIWSNGQVEGQINRLKTSKRAMFRRANVELLRARMMPLNVWNKHGLRDRPHETHRRPCHRLADRLGIGGVGLAAFDVRFT